MTIKTSSCKAKSRNLQNFVAGVLRITFPSLHETDFAPAIMGESGTDIKLSHAARQIFPWAVECKNQEHINIWKSWNQTEMNGLKEKLKPLLIMPETATTSQSRSMPNWLDFALKSAKCSAQ